MLVLVDPNESRAVRNKDMILDHYARMINGKDAETGTRNFDEWLRPAQPADGGRPRGVGQVFRRDRSRARQGAH